MNIHLHDAHDQTFSHWKKREECSLSDIGVHHRTIQRIPPTESFNECQLFFAGTGRIVAQQGWRYGRNTVTYYPQKEGRKQIPTRGP
jgi:hypothetical protein